MNRTAKDFYQYGLGAIVVIGFFTLLYLLMKSEMPVGNRDLLFLAAGTLLSQFTTVVTYFFGSSKGSSEKDIIISKKKEI